MTGHEPVKGGCGSGHCGCASGAEPEVAVEAATETPSINGVRLHGPGERLSADELLERAHTELLRQAAVQRGRLPAQDVSVAPPLNAEQRAAVEAMLDDEVQLPVPDLEACRRHYEANRNRYLVGQARHVRHILFAVTPGVDVHKLAQHAETALLELTRKDAAPGRFEELARTLSNCPSGAQGGDLGWLTPEDCAPELANELFHQRDSGWGMGVHPRLVHSRHGLHIVEVLGRRNGTLPPFEALAPRIADELGLQARATAWRQFMQLLVGDAEVRGMSLDGASSPLVQ
ncbi:MAG: peptidylprolyl isomerase [Hydrogenophaga sp.]|uniref:peptidylprolyl isomerase n=1 Tax=Hydrogenophaga intermedia TaxID=65786 RepID=UPI0020448E25|nr:peptidylprolyl isomerase [Hydrogenophaga intermedia]MCM3562372.1 peptidylprolyl isomerase [Hydrogenophaga intermedia]